MWITPEVSSQLAKHPPLEEGDFGRGGFYLVFVFYVPFGDLGGEIKWAIWKCSQSVTLPGPRAESIIWVR